MLNKKEQDEILTIIKDALRTKDLGIIALRTDVDEALVLYINDRETAIKNAPNIISKYQGN